MRGKTAKQIRKMAHLLYPEGHEYGQNQRTGAIVLMPSTRKLYKKLKEIYKRQGHF